MLSESGCGEFPQHQIVCERRFSARASQESSVADNDVIRCDACPVLCYIKEGRTGACDRYGNLAGSLYAWILILCSTAPSRAAIPWFHFSSVATIGTAI